MKQRKRPIHRISLDVKEKSLDGIRKALNTANAAVEKETQRCVRETNKIKLAVAEKADGQLGDYKVVTVANSQISGQVVAKSRAKIPYASLCTA